MFTTLSTNNACIITRSSKLGSKMKNANQIDKSEQIKRLAFVAAPTWPMHESKMHVLCILVELWEIFTKLDSFSEHIMNTTYHWNLEVFAFVVEKWTTVHYLGKATVPFYLILMLHAPFCLLPESWRLKKKIKELWRDRRFCEEETKLQGRSLYSLNKIKKKKWPSDCNFLLTFLPQPSLSLLI